MPVIAHYIINFFFLEVASGLSTEVLRVSELFGSSSIGSSSLFILIQRPASVKFKGSTIFQASFTTLELLMSWLFLSLES